MSLKNNKITALMLDDFIRDPVLAIRCIFGIDFPPHFELRIRTGWHHKFVIDSSGFGTGKSLSIALLGALRGMLLEERTEGYVSATFRQIQEVFQYFDKWSQSSPIFAAQVKKNRLGDPDIAKSDSSWELRFRNGSRLRAIPPNFNQDAETAGSEDWTDGYFDEWTKYPKIVAFMRQLFTRVRKPVSPRYSDLQELYPRIVDRHFYLCGTAKYRTHPCYPFVKDWSKTSIESNRHAVISLNFEDVPKKWHKLLEMDGILELCKFLPDDLLQQEVYGRWVKDGARWYNIDSINECRGNDIAIICCPSQYEILESL